MLLYIRRHNVVNNLTFETPFLKIQFPTIDKIEKNKVNSALHALSYEKKNPSEQIVAI